MARYPDLLREIAPHVDFDPAQEGPDIYVDIALTKIKHIFKNHFKELGLENDFTNLSDMTLYKTMKAMPLFNLYLYANGDVTVEQLKECITEGLNARKCYHMIILDSDAKATIEKVVSIQKEVHAIRTGEAEETTDETSEPSVSVEDLKSKLEEAKELIDKHKKAKQEALKSKEEVEGDFKELQRQFKELSLKATVTSEPVVLPADGSTPDGEMVFKPLCEVFPSCELNENVGALEVPVFEWSGPHPDVPQVDEHYVWRPELLGRVAYAFVTNQRMYLHGHTGSGKTTAIEQFCAALNYPFVRINFDSEILRTDLVGSLRSSEGTTWYQDGILAKALSQPCTICFDEIDYTRPDVAYVMQAVNEGNGLRILEDGDRLVQPNQWCRMFATGNTVGQGDEHGMYQGARPQSMAFLDRYTVWAKVDYLTEDERYELVSRHYPSLSTDTKKQLALYITEHLVAFEQGKVLQPISPRGMLAIAKATVMFDDLKEALTMTVLDRASSDDRATLVGIVDRIA